MAKSKRIQTTKRRSVGKAQRKKVAAGKETQRGTTRSNSKQATVIALLSSPSGNHGIGDHEGYRLAAAFSPRLFCRGRAQEAWPDA